MRRTRANRACNSTRSWLMCRSPGPQSSSRNPATICMTLPLSNLLVISLEQAVAAPMCSCRLADAGARVIKIERPEGAFARYYDRLAYGQSSYFVWLNRGKQSVVLDIKNPDDRELLTRLISRADVLVQNLMPGAMARAGFNLDELRRKHPRLGICSISGYGES